jgi:hypothetical protein
MVSPEDAFVVIAELSLALAGFAGVVSAFGGRNRNFNQVERMRLRMILSNSGTVLGGSLLLFVLSAGGLSGTATFMTVGISMAFLRGALLLRFSHAGVSALRDESTTVTPRSFAFANSIGFLSVGLYVTAAVLGGEAWPLMAGFSLQLLLGLMVFSRILTSAK